MEPRFNEPLFNEVLNITNNILCPSQSYSKMYGMEPWYNKFFDLTNIIQKPKHKIYLDITNYNVKTQQKINVNCCWFLFSSVYHFLFKFCYALNANCMLTGLLIFRAVAEPRISTKSVKSREIHQNTQNPAKFARNLTKYMSAHYIWKLSWLLGLLTWWKRANLPWNFVTAASKQHRTTTRRS